MSEEFLKTGEWLRKRAVSIGICALLLGAGVFILFQYGTRFAGAAPYLLFLACPLMHLFMHRSHGGQSSSSDADSIQRNERHHH